jgi:general stress protein 26
MPESYGVKRAGKGMISWSRVTEQLAKARNYWIVTSRTGGRVHATPVWGLWLDGAFYFSTDPASRKGRDIATNSKLIVHLESGDDVVIIEGVAEHLALKSSILSRFVNSYERKYDFRPDIKDSSYGVYRVRPTAAYGWLERNFSNSATRWLF